MSNFIVAFLFLVSAGIFEEVSKDRSPHTPPTRDEVIANVKSDATNENINELLRHLRGAAHYGKGSDSFLELQAVAMSMPNLSLRLGERIRTKKAEISGRDLQYDQLRQEILIGILPNLPSPETIAVLGGFIDEDKEHFVVPIWKGAYGNNYYAEEALSLIGLREPPWPEGSSDATSYVKDKKMLACNEWWAKVKAGQIAFSFEGQNVEYRFKPDGSWIEGPLGKTTRKDRATHSADGKLRSAKRGVSPVTDTGESAQDAPEPPGRLPWIVATLLILLGGGLFFKIRRAV